MLLLRNAVKRGTPEYRNRLRGGLTMGRSDTGLQQPVGQTAPTPTQTVSPETPVTTPTTSPATPTLRTPVTTPPPAVQMKLSLRDAWARMSPFAQQWLGRLGNSRG